MALGLVPYTLAHLAAAHTAWFPVLEPPSLTLRSFVLPFNLWQSPRELPLRNFCIKGGDSHWPCAGIFADRLLWLELPNPRS